MDYAIQKAVELGITTLIPLITERSVPIEKHRIPKREQHWQKIIQSSLDKICPQYFPLNDSDVYVKIKSLFCQ